MNWEKIRKTHALNFNTQKSFWELSISEKLKLQKIMQQSKFKQTPRQKKSGKSKLYSFYLYLQNF